MFSHLPIAAELTALLARHLPWLGRTAHQAAPLPQAGDPTDGTGLRMREFSSYPALASWCLDRVPATESGHFAMGYGRAFVTLVDLMHADPRRRIRLLAISENVELRERLRCVLACQVEDAGGSPPVTAVLYEQGDGA